MKALTMMNTKICVVGLGYVGFPLINKFAQAGFTDLVGVDYEPKIDSIKQAKDHTGLIPAHILEENLNKVEYTTVIPDDAKVYIICVPTPSIASMPDYIPLGSACMDVAVVCRDDCAVVVESTVAPGTIQGRVKHIFNKANKKNVALVYSPERIDPSPEAYTSFTDCTKLIGVDDDYLQARLVADIYAKVFKDTLVVYDTRAAELAKCFENFQRDMNIAMMNEMAMHCNVNGIDVKSVMAALQTKDTGLNFHSGMVGGHCIPEDPYFLAEWYGGGLPTMSRLTNETYIKFLADLIVDAKIFSGEKRILIIGATYKPDVKDDRKSGSYKLQKLLKDRGYESDIYDPLLQIDQTDDDTSYNIVVGAVNHAQFKNKSIYKICSVTVDCIFFNVGQQFTTRQVAGLYKVENV